MYIYANLWYFSQGWVYLRESSESFNNWTDFSALLHTSCPLQVTVSSLNEVLEYFLQVTEYRLCPFLSSQPYDTQIGETNAAIEKAFRLTVEKMLTKAVNACAQQACHLHQFPAESPCLNLKLYHTHKLHRYCSQTSQIYCFLKRMLNTFFLRKIIKIATIKVRLSINTPCLCQGSHN